MRPFLCQVYPGDVLDTNAVIEFLTSEEALELPDKIEEVEEQDINHHNYEIRKSSDHHYDRLKTMITIRWTMRICSV